MSQKVNPWKKVATFYSPEYEGQIIGSLDWNPQKQKFKLIVEDNFPLYPGVSPTGFRFMEEAMQNKKVVWESEARKKLYLSLFNIACL